MSRIEIEVEGDNGELATAISLYNELTNKKHGMASGVAAFKISIEALTEIMSAAKNLIGDYHSDSDEFSKVLSRNFKLISLIDNTLADFTNIKRRVNEELDSLNEMLDKLAEAVGAEK